MGTEFCRQLAEKPSVLKDLYDLLSITRRKLSIGTPYMQRLTNDRSGGNATTYSLLLDVMDQIFG